ncbi:esterase-like activity of phytase family protein [Endozoicomonas arenosclerae]|uniref:esterase-like activity of phytase family protein n=1 Tax=Endozoicomonas arenosclerae TaxID=1633495 RepID=UPI000785E79E|nr:esterase-like activity of phytase family protein [Endozoicomonas arenosclerae]
MLFKRQLITLMALTTFAGMTQATPFINLEFIGEATFPTGEQVLDTELGGLSGLDYDAVNNRFISISDDRAQKGKARFYELTMDLEDGRLDSGDIEFTSVTEILDKDGQSFSAASVDPEAIRLSPFPNLLYWTSEGDANQGLPPFVRIMTRNGQYVDEFALPEKYAPAPDRGIRNNLAFESLTFSYNGKHLYTATEGALKQDGPASSLESGSPIRVMKLNGKTGKPGKEFIYETDPVIDAPEPQGAFSTNGLVELLSLGPGYFIAVERAFSVGKGNSIRLYLTNTHTASNVKKLDSIEGKSVWPMDKYLLLDLADLNIKLDNIEGISFGPTLPTGEKTLILVSDNNFNPNGQFTQFLAFKIQGF